MPRITRAFIKLALLYLSVALLVGLLTSAAAWLPWSEGWRALGPGYFHLFMVGWVMQLIIGIAYWMFPRWSRERPRGSDRMTWGTLLLLNGGLLLRVVAEPALALSARWWWGLLLALSALLQWVGALLFVLNTWPRVKEK